MVSTIPLKEVNNFSYENFIAVFGSVIEEGRFAAAWVWESRPFSGVEGVCTAFADFLHSLSYRSKRGVVRCYPDLAGKLSEKGALSQESTREHVVAGLLELTDEDRKELTTLNDNYKSKFNFPFVVCARENKTETIKRELKIRVRNDEEEEVNNAIGEIIKISGYRIKDLITSSNL